MKEKLKVGFVGCGSHATRNIYPALKSARIDLVCTCDIDEEKARRNGRQFGALRHYTDHRKMFENEDLDAAFIIIDHQLHHEISIEALRNGFHVFVEKPPASSLKDTQEMERVSKETGKHVMVGFMERFATAFRIARKVIDKEDFGKVSLISSNWYSGPYPSFLDYLREFAIHHFDLFRHFAGNVDRVYAEKCQIAQDKISVVVTLLFKNGAVGTMNLGSSRQWNKNDERVEITGDGEFLTVDNRSRLLYYPKKDWVQLPRIIDEVREPASGQALSWEPNITIPDVHNHSGYLNGYVAEVVHFAEAVLAGKQPSPNISDGVAAMQLVDTVYRCAGTDKVVQV